MRTSQYLLSTLKETPADAEVISHQLMLRAGMIRKLASGLYTWLPTGVRVLKKVENIVREEMNNAGAIEVLMPVVQPSELWQESGRWEQYGPELLRIADRGDRPFVLGPTHAVLPILEDFKPDLIINSAGQDNHFTDPLANMSASVLVLDDKLRIVDFNDSAVSILPALSEDAVGLAVRDVFPEQCSLDVAALVQNEEMEIALPVGGGLRFYKVSCGQQCPVSGAVRGLESPGRCAPCAQRPANRPGRPLPQAR